MSSLTIFKISFLVGVILLLLRETHHIVISNYVLVIPFAIAGFSLIAPVLIGLATILVIAILGKNKQKKDENDKDN